MEIFLAQEYLSLALSDTWLGWARNMEHSNLCQSGIDWNHVVSHHHIQHVQVNLTKRKDEQRKASKGESRAEELRGMPSIF